ncbi:hypothetical protein [Desulfobacca acetoxidans]
MIQDYLKAGYPVLLVRTHDPERFIGSGIKEANGRTAYQWDVVRGFRDLGNGAEWEECDPNEEAVLDAAQGLTCEEAE